MAVEDTKIPYEILIRYGLDGAVQGVHAQYLRKVVVDGEVLKEEITPAEDVTLEGFATSQIMDDTTKSALARVVSLEADNLALTAQIATLQASQTQYGDLAQSLAAQLAEANTLISTLKASSPAST